MRCCLRCGGTPRSRSWPSRPATPAPRSSPTSTTSTSRPATPSPRWPSASAPTWSSSDPRCRWCSASPTRCARQASPASGRRRTPRASRAAKSFAKDVMTAARRAHRHQRDRRQPRPPRRRAGPVRPAGRRPAWVVKDDGLAAGKGVVVTADRDAARAHAASLLDAGHPVLLESFLDGPEVSLFCVVDGETVVPLLPAQDFKRVGDDDTGPNTGGMGAYAPLPWLPDDVVARIVDEVVKPVAAELVRARQLVLGPALRRAGDHVARVRRWSNSTAASAIPRRSACSRCWKPRWASCCMPPPPASWPGSRRCSGATAPPSRWCRRRELSGPPAGGRRHPRRRSRRRAARGHRPPRGRRRRVLGRPGAVGGRHRLPTWPPHVTPPTR